MLDRLLAEWVTDIIEAAGLVVLRTPPGSANLVANALDAAAIEGVAGTIAGTTPSSSRLARGRCLVKSRENFADAAGEAKR
jgi:transcriptional regulator of arginine metabolism